MTQYKKRDSNIELLRIFSMLLIVSLHFWGKCILPSNEEMFTFTNLFGWCIRGISFMGVNIFVLISAYFLCESEFRLDKLIRLLLVIWFYSIFLFIIAVIFGKTSFTFMNLIRAIFPVLTGEYWFVTIYVGLYLLSPILNILLNTVNKRQLQYILVLLVSLFCVIPNLFFFSTWLRFGEGFGIVWFSVLYFVGAYVRLYVNSEIFIKNKVLIWLISIGLWLMPFISKIIIALVSISLTGHVLGSSVFYTNNSIIMLAACFSTFLAFRTISINSEIFRSAINFIAKSTLSVYLIQENRYVREPLWNFLKQLVNSDSWTVIFQYLVIVLAIFFCCIAIDLLRRLLFTFASRYWSLKRTSVKISQIIPADFFSIRR